MAARMGGRTSSAVRTRERRLREKPSGSAKRNLGSGDPDPPVTPLALLEVEDGLQEVPATELGPVDVGDPDLGVGDLPEQKVGDTHFAARSDQQVGIGQTRGVEAVGERLLVDGARVERSL